MQEDMLRFRRFSSFDGDGGSDSASDGGRHVQAARVAEEAFGGFRDEVGGTLQLMALSDVEARVARLSSAAHVLASEVAATAADGIAAATLEDGDGLRWQARVEIKGGAACAAAGSPPSPAAAAPAGGPVSRGISAIRRRYPDLF